MVIDRVARGIDFVEQASAPHVAGGLPAFGAGENLGQAEAVLDQVGGRASCHVGRGNPVPLRIVTVGDAAGAFQTVANIILINAKRAARQRAAGHVAIGIMNNRLAFKRVEAVVRPVGHGPDRAGRSGYRLGLR